MASVIRLEKVTKTYVMGEEQLHALDEVDLEIKKGESISIIGPSGSGKSTLMHMIGLLDTPTSGKIFVEKSDTSNMTSEQLAKLRNKSIGFVFQAFNLLSKTSAIDNVELPLIYSGMRRADRIKEAKKALNVVGLTDRAAHKPSELSGGQQQRVAIARALVNSPSLILADEPTGNLDSKSGEEIIDLLLGLNKKGNTLILVTHEEELARKAKRLIKIIDGKIVEDKKT